jgi:hypothetical protein
VSGWILVALAFAVVIAGCARADAAGPLPERSPEPVLAARSMTPSAVARPTYAPGGAHASGRVMRLTPVGIVIASVERSIEVDLRRVVDVWRETSVPASALEVGDDVFVNGDGGSPFVARYVWANIGRLDGVIESIDATGMVLGVSGRAGQEFAPRTSVRVEFSAFVEFGAPGVVTTTRADLVIGRTIGAVTYRPRVGAPRVTRIWAEPVGPAPSRVPTSRR